MRIVIFFILCFISTLSLANEKLSLILDWFPNPTHAPIFIAKEKGFFQQQGLDVTIINPSNPSDAPKLVAAKKADIGITYEPQFIEQVDQGLPLIRIGTLIDNPLDCLAVLESSNINTLSDLKNKQVGHNINGINSISLKTMLEKNGLSVNDVKHINIQFDLTKALLAKKVDAVTGIMRNYEVIQMKLMKQPARVFFPEQYGVPNYSELIFVMNTDNINKPIILKFLKALENATEFIQSNPEASWNIFIKNHPSLNDELNRLSWFDSIKYFSNHPSRFNTDQWKNFIDFMYKNKLIKNVYPIERYSIDLNKD